MESKLQTYVKNWLTEQDLRCDYKNFTEELIFSLFLKNIVSDISSNLKKISIKIVTNNKRLKQITISRLYIFSLATQKRSLTRHRQKIM